MTPVRAGIVVALLTFFGGGEAYAQRSAEPTVPTTYELVLRDGSRIYGTIEKNTPEELVIRTGSGVLVTAQRVQVVSLKPVRGRVVGGEFQRTDPTATRLFFAPTARGLKKGEAYLGVYEVFVPSLQVGVTNRISIGGGTPLLFFGDDDWDRPFWVTPKVQLFDNGRVQVAAGVFHAFVIGDDGGGIGYGVATAGSDTTSLTAGAGVAYDVDGGRSFLVMLGGDRQIARNIKLITENYVWKGGDGILSAGLRFFGEQLSADVGLAIPIGADEFFAFPVVNFVYSF
jgi:hypothetical protein